MLAAGAHAATAEGVAPERRATAVNVRFEVPQQFGTNIGAQPNSTVESYGVYGVDVHAGVTYNRFDILASANLGIDSSKIRVKLVVFDIRAEKKECPEIEPFDWMPAPFNGEEIDVTAHWVLPLDTTVNSFASVMFPRAGMYRLCYTTGEPGTDWYLLGDDTGPGIFVVGALSRLKAEEKVWCPLAPMQAMYNADKLCLTDPTRRGCQCMGKIEGRKRRTDSPYDFMPLGLPDPATPEWRVWITDMGKECAVGGAADPNPLEVGAGYDGYQRVYNYQGYEVHNFGVSYNPEPGFTTFTGSIGTFKLCYCSGLSMDGSSETCKNVQQDYPQTIGRLVILGIVTTNYELVVYPTLRFDLYICCGSQECVGRNQGEGACSEEVGTPRYKIVANNPSNDYLYFESESGCRTANQLDTYSTDSKIIGGHLGPDNCNGAADCHHLPLVPDGCSPGTPCADQRTKPTFKDVQIDASYDNMVQMRAELDICYCDDTCTDPLNWFKAGHIIVYPMLLELQNVDGDLPEQIQLSNPSIGSAIMLGSAVVNTPVWVVIKGSDNYGGWSSESSPDPTKTREMKILRDECGRPDRPCEMKIKCLSEEQPNVVTGHRLVSGNTDYTEPITLLNGINPVGQRYGSQCAAPVNPGDEPLCEPAIEISEPGWFVMCYCDTNCNEVANWALVGRELITGPDPGQTWRRYTETTFSLSITGWGLKATNKLRLLSPNDDLSFCGMINPRTGSEYGPTDSGHGPKPPATGRTTEALVWSKSEADNALITTLEYNVQGTKVAFNKRHGLVDGDRVMLEGVRVLAASDDPWDTDRASKVEKMYSSVHEVTLGCDDEDCHEILIPVSFLAADFPVFTNPSSINWYRNSEAQFDNIRIRYGYPSLEGRGYRVCWAPDANSPYVGQVGELRVDDPLLMESRLGLTTVLPQETTVAGRGSPVVVYFKTGTSARYEQSDGPMHLYLAIMPGLINYDLADWSQVMEPMDWQLKSMDETEAGDFVSWESASQVFCGRMFLEMWSADPGGFPMPDGCYFKEDIVHDGRPPVKEIHLRFGARNGLKKETVYMLVLNMNIIMYDDATRVLDIGFPDTGAVWVWSMDDYNNDPFSVIELGQAKPGELDARRPPKTPDGNFLVLGEFSDDPRFHPDDGFKVVASDGWGAPGAWQELNGWCLPNNGNLDTPLPVSAGGRACMPCNSEEDCGNGNEFTAPNPDYSWCQSPIDTKCLDSDEATLIDAPAFHFTFRAAPLSKIERTDIIRVFLHPLTQWNIGGCVVDWNENGCPGACDPPNCAIEAVVGGVPTGVGQEFPLNIMKIDLPSKMGGYFSGNETGSIIVGSLVVPAGGFLPTALSAEVMESTETKPDYFPFYRSGGPPGLMLYKKPRIVAASMVVGLGDGNQYPFMDDETAGGDYPYNTLYFKLVFGATLFAKSGSSIILDFILPFNSGYACMPPSQGGSAVPQLEMLENTFPTGQGNLQGAVEFFADADPYLCRVRFEQNLALYARQSAFVSLRVRNPQQALKYDDEINLWNLTVYGSQTDTWYYTPMMHQVLSNRMLNPCEGFYFGKARSNFLCTEMLPPGYDGKVSVLGKITNFLISPSNFGVNEMNFISVFFRTQQMVGNLVIVETELWIDAPSTFEFGQYCAGSHLDSFYYIPEGVGTTKLPVGQVFVCMGEPKTTDDETFNRAKVKLTGRLVGDTLYGFRVEVKNAPQYMRNQQVSVVPYEEPWTIWTYQWTADTYWGSSPIQTAVDGAFYTAKFNEESPEYKSWGVFQRNMPPENFGVTFADLTPTPAGAAPVEIKIMPIIVSVEMRRAMRVSAPAGYVWDFEQVEFRFKRRAPGVLESLIVDGVEADMPLSGVPARPVSPPKNVLTVDYMQGAWTPGVRYGFVAKIRIPYVPPTGSANQFTIEFGYNENLDENRLEAGVTGIPLVKSLINGGIDYTTSIRNRSTLMTFSVRTVSFIPNGGGLLITGPPNFKFEQFCQPKPLQGYDDFPPDITCLYEEDPTSGVPQVRIYAGGEGIPPAHYMFTLDAQNPPQKYITNLGEWMYQSFSQMSEQITLDGNTSIPGYPINERMGGPAEYGVVGGELRMPPYVFCDVNSEEMMAAFGVQKTNCDFEHWQFYPALGGARDDRPSRPSALVIKMVLTSTPDGTYDLVVRAPKGYLFDTDCKVMTYPSAKVYDETVTDNLILQGKALWVTHPETWQRIPVDSPDGPGVSIEALTPAWRPFGYRSFNQRYNVWPSPGIFTGGAEMLGCKGNGNVARITLTKGLQAGGKGYVFRLSVLSNPPETPKPNTFTLEYAGEASEDFEGVKIWAFENITIVPTTTATSSKFSSTMNLVTITIKPVNDIPHGGHLRITAPAEFQVPTSCNVEISPHPNMGLNYTSLSIADLQWAEFLPSDVVCEGDETASSRARLLFTRNNKFMKAQIVYVIKLNIRNPETTTPYEDEWNFASYQDLLPNDLIDEATGSGFTINSAVEAFAYLRPSSYNANAKQRIDFNMSFPAVVEIGDRIEIVAPVTYYFSERGSHACPQYLYLQGSLRRTAPKCGGNMMWWEMEEETIPAGDVIRFMVQIKNPAYTPEINLFQLRQIKPGGSRRSSRMIQGYEIIPELVNASVVKAVELPLGQCRKDVPIAATSPCHAVGSVGAFVLHFTPTRSAQLLSLQADVNGDPFDFTDAIFNHPVGDVLVPEARSARAMMAQLILYANLPFSLRVDRVQHPGTSGIAMFDITTYTDQFEPAPTTMPVLRCSESNGACGTFPPSTARRDEKLQLHTFEMLGYINVATSSYVNPIYYSTLAGTVTVEMRATYDFEPNDVLRITRAQGYTLLDRTLLALLSIRFDDNQHGLDVKRVWSNSFLDPDDYWAIISDFVTTDTTVMFNFKADLPTEAYPAPFWGIRTYRILPLYDFDGEILNATQPWYPWPGRGKVILGTNDDAFPDFLLVGPIPFTVEPQLQTPKAYTEISFVFNVEQEVSAVSAREVQLDITGPEGFMFLDSCFVSPLNPAFSKCTGYRNTASMVTIQPRLRGTGILVILGAYNPRLTPSPNYWSAAVFTDDPNQYVRWSQELSYEIVGMPVVYKGNNQLGESASGFFTFSPVRPSPSPVIHLVITPPPNMGYRVFCTGISPLGFVRMPQCQSGGVNEPLSLTFDNATLVAGNAYTFGVTVYNPGGPPAETSNYWGLSVLDYNFKTFDANMDIPGLDLGSMPIRCYGIGWTSAAPRVMAEVLIQLRVLHLIPAGTITVITIRAPEGVMFSEDASAVRVIPMPLPLIAGMESSIAGDVLILNLDVNQDLKAALYNVRFEVINPVVYPHDNTWSVFAKKNIDIEFSHVVTGYVQGQISPFDLTIAGISIAAKAGPRLGAASGFGLRCACAAAALAALRAASPRGGR